jgi:hypothetical protein
MSLQKRIRLDRFLLPMTQVCTSKSRASYIVFGFKNEATLPWVKLIFKYNGYLFTARF